MNNLQKIIDRFKSFLSYALYKKDIKDLQSHISISTSIRENFKDPYIITFTNKQQYPIIIYEENYEAKSQTTDSINIQISDITSSLIKPTIISVIETHISIKNPCSINIQLADDTTTEGKLVQLFMPSTFIPTKQQNKHTYFVFTITRTCLGKTIKDPEIDDIIYFVNYSYKYDKYI